jgi:peptidoglycan/xylan/chitin deacetylase (PgdA/CDA1 family)
MAIVFTGDEFGEGGDFILKSLAQQNIKASFFLTGKFYRNPSFQKTIKQLRASGHYLGAHSDHHLLYCDWLKRDSLLVTRKEFIDDLDANYEAMGKFGIRKEEAGYFLPPYEWYNDSISRWTSENKLQLINYTPGTLSHADYTTPDLKNYRSSKDIMKSITDYEKTHPAGLNGFILLMHIGAGSARTDKFYARLPELLNWLREKNYKPVRIDELLKD